MTLTAHPTFPAKGAANFNALILAWAQFMAGTNKTELDALVVSLNALSASMTSVAAGGAMTLPYTYSSTITDADPGAGYLRLSSATQNASTVIRLDLLGSDGSTWTSVIDTFDDSTSTIKGNIMLQKLSDATKWLEFSVSSLASPSGYKNITVVPVASSATNPFTDGDALVLKFTRNGDAGPTGAAGVSGSWIPVAVINPSAAANIDLLTVFTSDYDTYRIVGTGLTVAADDYALLQLAAAGSVDAGSNYYGLVLGGTTTATSTSITASPTITSAGKGCSFEITVSNVNDATRLKTIHGFAESEATATPGFRVIQPFGIYTAANAASGFRLKLSGGSNWGNTGAVRVFAYKNT